MNDYDRWYRNYRRRQMIAERWLPFLAGVLFGAVAWSVALLVWG